MGNVYSFGLFVCLLISQIVVAQTAPFTGSWSFEGSDNGSSSNPLIGVSSVNYSNVNKAFGTFTSGFAGLGVSVQHWATSGCNAAEYVEFSVQPQGTVQVTLTSLSFAFSRSDTGPQQIMVRSSADGFNGDFYSGGVSETYQTASISLNGGSFTNQSSSITFRIYACNASHTGGTLKLDEIRLNGQSLPVTLLSFTAKPEGDRVQLAWVTAAERNADRFVVERSVDLSEYTNVNEVIAKGTTNERQYYGLTDLNPLPGINYYRLKQIDLDGAVHKFKPVSVIIRATEPFVAVYPNPASPNRIHLRLWNADGAIVRLLTVTGQVMTGRLERQSGGADLLFDNPLPTGLYWLEMQLNERRQLIKVLVQ
jgi:hypothetical protein